MKNALFVLAAFAAAFLSVSCSEKGGGEDDGNNEKKDFYITTYPELTNADMPAFAGFLMVFAFNEYSKQFLSKETYASFEMYSNDGLLKFAGGFADSEGRVRISKIFIDENRSYVDKLPYSYYLTVPMVASKVGEYEFAIKFYQPATDQSFMTPRYRMKFWAEENGLVGIKTTLIE